MELLKDLWYSKGFWRFVAIIVTILSFVILINSGITYFLLLAVPCWICAEWSQSSELNKARGTIHFQEWEYAQLLKATPEEFKKAQEDGYLHSKNEYVHDPKNEYVGYEL